MKCSLAYKFFWLAVLLTGFTTSCFGQDTYALIPTEKPTGKVKSITSKRTYFVYKGERVTPYTEIVGTDNYSEDGNLIQTSVFGNGEERTTYTWTGNTFTASVQYFDLKGTPAPELSNHFTQNANDISETGLCADYTTRKEKDASANVERVFEICKDKSLRRSTVYEMTPDNHVFRMVVEDAKGRTWERKNNYGVNFSILGFRFTVNDLSQPKYWQEVTFSNQQQDDKKNIISRTCTMTSSRYPGQVRFEYLDEDKIIYYVK